MLDGATMRFAVVPLVLLSTVLACGGQVVGPGDAGDDVRSGVAAGKNAPAPTSASASASPGVIATIDGGYFQSMTADDTTLYLGRDGHIFSLPKTGGTPKAIFDERPENQSDTTGIAVDDQYVYFTGTGAKTLSRVPKTGGPRQILATLEYPEEIAIDDANVYVAVNDEGIVRVPKAGGEPTVLASGQHLPQAIALAGDTVYFGVADSADYQAGSNGAIRSVPKNGGAVTDVATGVSGQPWHLAVTTDAVFYVDYGTRSLMRAPLGQTGAPSVVQSGAFELAIAGDASGVFVAQLAVGSNAATVYEVKGQDLHSLASWSFRESKPGQRFPGSGGADASVATVVDATHVYWLAYETDDLAYERTTVRAAVR